MSLKTYKFTLTGRSNIVTFLPRDAMHKRGLCLCRRAVSVCLSRSSKRLDRPIYKTFSPSGSHTILVFCAPNGFAIFRRGHADSPSGGVKYRGYEKKSRFSTSISLYLVNDAKYGHSYYGSRIGNRTQAFEWYHFQ